MSLPTFYASDPFFAAVRHFLLELKDVILLATLVAALAISAFQFIKWKLYH